MNAISLFRINELYSTLKFIVKKMFFNLLTSIDSHDFGEVCLILMTNIFFIQMARNVVSIHVYLRQISNQRHIEQEMSALLIATMLEVDCIYITYISTCILIVLVINMYIRYNKTVINYEYCNLHTTQCMIIIKEYPCRWCYLSDN